MVREQALLLAPGGMEQILKHRGLHRGAWPDHWGRAQGCPKACDTKGMCCPCRECSGAEAKVTVFAYLTPCFNDCGPYGQCSLLRRHGYLYAGCSCKAGECLSWEALPSSLREKHSLKWWCLSGGAWGLPWPAVSQCLGK